MSLWMHLPVYVATSGGRLWKVDGERISLAAADAGKQGQ